jgi:HEAT repeat protein
LIALEYISGALERGSTNDEIRQTLEYLSLEGTTNRVREGGRLVNDYPDVRRQAARYLGTVGTREAKAALIRICTSDIEPMVLQEAVK